MEYILWNLVIWTDRPGPRSIDPVLLLHCLLLAMPADLQGSFQTDTGDPNSL